VHQPLTSLLSLALGGIWLLLQQHGLGYDAVGLSYERVVGERQLWRMGSSQLAHVDALHLVFNLSALWSLGILERSLGTLYYLQHTILLFVLSPLVSKTHAHIREAV
jgi:membrane associated rhomboid family serine protease